MTKRKSQYTSKDRNTLESLLGKCYNKSVKEGKGDKAVWLRAFFHKIKIRRQRRRGVSIPSVDEIKRWGNEGEDQFSQILLQSLPSCKIKRNIIIQSNGRSAELDFLILYQNKLFAIEVKRWKGRLTQQEYTFIQEKTDPWTGEIHTKEHKSPFKQIGRNMYLLKNQISVNAWVNQIVFFDIEGLESVTVFTDDTWFARIDDLVEYIKNDGKISFGNSASVFFEKCIPADLLYDQSHNRSLRCMIDRTTLCFPSAHGIVSWEDIREIRIVHHRSYDELHIKMKNGAQEMVVLENAQIGVFENGRKEFYSLCKMDYIQLGCALGE